MTSLSSFGYLEYLHLGWAQLSNTTFVNLLNLTHLWLESCEFDESINAHTFLLVPNIEFLRLMNCSKLVHLDLRYLTKLRWLSVTLIDSFEFLASLPVSVDTLLMDELDVNPKKIKKYIQRSGCSPRVLGIDAYESRLDSRLFENFNRLEHLVVNFATQLDPRAQVEYARIKSLRIQGNSMLPTQDVCLAPLVNLESLDLTDNYSMKLDSKTFSSLTKLRELCLRGALTFQNAALCDGTLFNGLGQLLILDLSDNRINEIHEDLFAHTPKLERLNLRASFINCIENQPFRHLSNLKYLDLSLNTISLLYSGLSGLKALEHLRLEGNSLEKLVRKNFKSLDQLRSLSTDLPLENINPSVFDDLNNLENLWICVKDEDNQNEIRHLFADKKINLYF